MDKVRINVVLVKKGLVSSKSQADKLIKLGKVRINSEVVVKPNHLVSNTEQSNIQLDQDNHYVSRAAYKLDSIVRKLGISFADQVVLDVGSSTGGFTNYALEQGAKKVIAVDKGSNQMDTLISSNSKVELHEKTDILDFKPSIKPSIVLIDVSFMSIREVLKSLVKTIDKNTLVIAMVKPQFEVNDRYKNKGIVKNEKIRRQILNDFEMWVKHNYTIINKADSLVSGTKGNIERFYLLKLI